MNTDFNQFFQSFANSMYAPGNDTSISNYAKYPAWNDNDQVDMITPVPAPVPAPAPTPTALHACNFPACNKRFKRPYDLVRHQNSVHMNANHLCPIAGCPKARNGAGYRRSDKVTEHLWKKHGDLGYTKA
ncbi:hypothetical protein BDZ45DRAFT_682355 [Acephala macrosclerotiorum]|nr:hypothetical protein BDZ45DRAFT_682355 [Acephala macrosclerotiorum]